MRIIVAFLALFFSVVISKLLLKKYILKTKYYVDFNNFNNKMINEINFEKRTLLNIVNKFDNSNDFSNRISEYYKTNGNYSNLEYLTEEDNLIFSEYVEFLGKTDTNTQIKQLKIYQNILDEKVKVLKVEEKEKNELYLKMGVMIGLTLFIIII